MPGYDIIVIGASAGGAAALQNLAGRLPPHLKAAIFCGAPKDALAQIPFGGNSVSEAKQKQAEQIRAVVQKLETFQLK